MLNIILVQDFFNKNFNVLDFRATMAKNTKQEEMEVAWPSGLGRWI